MKNEFAASAGLAIRSSGKALGLNNGTMICSLLCYELLKQPKEGKRGEAPCLVFLGQK